MKKLVILAVVVMLLGLLGVVSNARLLGQVDEVATLISFRNAFSIGETHVDPAEWKASTTRNAIFDIVLYAAGFVCGIGILWRQRWARFGILAFTVILVVMSSIALAQIHMALFARQLLYSLAVASMAWWVLFGSSSEALFSQERAAQMPVRERPKSRVEAG